MTIQWPSDTATTVDNIRDVIGRNISIFSTGSGIACWICSLNPITGKSVDPFCPVCSGYYYINTLVEHSILAVVSYGYVDDPWRTSGGKLEKGDATIQIKYTSANEELVNTASYYIVDNKKYLSKGIALRGVPAINRILVVLKEQEG